MDEYQAVLKKGKRKQQKRERSTSFHRLRQKYKLKLHEYKPVLSWPIESLWSGFENDKYLEVFNIYDVQKSCFLCHFQLLLIQA